MNKTDSVQDEQIGTIIRDCLAAHGVKNLNTKDFFKAVDATATLFAQATERAEVERAITENGLTYRAIDELKSAAKPDTVLRSLAARKRVLERRLHTLSKAKKEKET